MVALEDVSLVVAALTVERAFPQQAHGARRGGTGWTERGGRLLAASNVVELLASSLRRLQAAQRLKREVDGHAPHRLFRLPKSNALVVGFQERGETVAMPGNEDPVNARTVRSWLDASKGATWEDGATPVALFETNRTSPDVVLAGLDEWLAAELSLASGGSSELPWFFELVTRWQGAGRVAFESGETKVSYDELESLTAARARAWRAQGVDASAKICVCRAFGVEYLVDLLTAFRIGACVAWVPTCGAAYERAAARAFEPSFVSGAPEALRRLGELGALVLASEPRWSGSWAAQSEARSYARTQPCLAVLSPTAADADGESPSFQPTVLTCEALRRAVARDARVIWRLRPGDLVAAPGFEGLRHQPGLLLSCLLAGGCYVHVTEEALRRDARVLERSFRVLGVNAASRDVWLATPEARPTAHLWFRDLEEPIDAEAWRRFVDEKAGESLHCAVCTEPALGGVLLATPHRRGPLNGDARVALGVAFDVIPLDGAPPDAASGLLEAKGLGTAPYLMLSQVSGERFRYLGTLRARRNGCVFPSALVAQAATALPGVVGAQVVAVPAAERTGGFRFGLVVFVRARTSWSDERDAATRRVVDVFLQDAFGADHRPDFVECHPLAPAFDESGTAAGPWISGQRVRGTLKKKAKLRVFRELAFLVEEGR